MPLCALCCAIFTCDFNVPEATLHGETPSSSQGNNFSQISVVLSEIQITTLIRPRSFCIKQCTTSLWEMFSSQGTLCSQTRLIMWFLQTSRGKPLLTETWLWNLFINVNCKHVTFLQTEGSKKLPWDHKPYEAAASVLLLQDHSQIHVLLTASALDHLPKQLQGDICKGSWRWMRCLTKSLTPMLFLGAPTALSWLCLWKHILDTLS